MTEVAREMCVLLSVATMSSAPLDESTSNVASDEVPDPNCADSMLDSDEKVPPSVLSTMMAPPGRTSLTLAGTMEPLLSIETDGRDDAISIPCESYSTAESKKASTPTPLSIVARFRMRNEGARSTASMVPAAE